MSVLTRPSMWTSGLQLHYVTNSLDHFCQPLPLPTSPSLCQPLPLPLTLSTPPLPTSPSLCQPLPLPTSPSLCQPLPTSPSLLSTPPPHFVNPSPSPPLPHFVNPSPSPTLCQPLPSPPLPHFVNPSLSPSLCQPLPLPLTLSTPPPGRYFQLKQITLPSELRASFLAQIIEAEDAQTEMFVQDLAVVNAEIQREVRAIENEAERVNEQANADSALIGRQAQANVSECMQTSGRAQLTPPIPCRLALLLRMLAVRDWPCCMAVSTSLKQSTRPPLTTCGPS